VSEVEKQPEGVVHRRSRIRKAMVREGFHGDWSVVVWIPSESEAESFARAANAWLREREAAAGEP
jgi:hypothetical protein